MNIEQEPEAWIIVNRDTGYRTQVAYLIPLYEKEMFEVIPLYTAPPKREPLDNVEIMTIAAEHTWDLKSFARAIEKAHGIGVDNE